MATIRKVRFELIASNPNADPLFERVEKALFRDGGALNATIEATGENINFEGTVYEEATHAVLYGNGKCVFKGEDRYGQETIVESSKMLDLSIKEIEDSDEGRANALSEIMRSKLLQLQKKSEDEK